METTRYYSTQRPVAPGTFPKRGAVAIVNFDSREYVDEINREAWGYVEYDHELSNDLAESYELVMATCI